MEQEYEDVSYRLAAKTEAPSYREGRACAHESEKSRGTQKDELDPVLGSAVKMEWAPTAVMMMPVAYGDVKICAD